MSYLVGGSDIYSTWGAFRTPIGIGYPGTTNSTEVTLGFHSFEFINGFKGIDGGLFRFNPFYEVNPYGGDPPRTVPRLIYVEVFHTDPEPTETIFFLQALADYPQPSLMQYERNGLIGATLTMTYGSFTITAAAVNYESPYYQTVSPFLGEILGLSGCVKF